MAEERIESLLPTDMLERFRERAARYDADNVFFAEDFEELQASGYLAAPVPAALGGVGLSLEKLVIAQRRLASYAPATALGVNMHLVWVQVAAYMRERARSSGAGAASTGAASTDSASEKNVGGTSPDAEAEGGVLGWVLRDALAGEVFAFGISEAGNEAVLMDAHTQATLQADGSYSVTGTKIFTTLSPVWTRLGVHASVANGSNIYRDGSGNSSKNGGGNENGSNKENDQPSASLIFGFVRREQPGAGTDLAGGTISHPGSWNPLGMRATQSYTTKLDGVRVAKRDIAARIAPYDGRDPLILAIFSSFSILTAAVYAGIADRALVLATEASHLKIKLADGSENSKFEDPDVLARLTAAVLAHRGSLDALEILARDVDEQRARNDWFLALAACRNLVTDEARAAVDVAMRLVGARGFQADSELARIYRDVLAGMFHPSSSRALSATVRATLSSV